ncbi:MAG: hypothetical protein R6U61_03500 [Thermoplasmata archaeon]
MRRKNSLRVLSCFMIFCLLITSSAGLIGSKTHEENDILQEKESAIPRGDIDLPAVTGTVYVLVNSTIYPELSQSLQVYKSDLENRGWTVSIFENTYNTAEEVRNFLIDGYNNANPTLVGAVFVGNLPYAEFEIQDDFGEEGVYSRFPIDHFYTDLTGDWYDNDGNGVYDDHETGWISSPEDPEIWFGRILMNTDWTTEIDLYQGYFHKIHEYKVGNISLPHKSLLYVDDDWSSYASGWESDLNIIYSDVTTVSDNITTNATDYTKRVHQGYEWTQVHCHANHKATRHAFMLDDGVKGSGGNFTSNDLFNDSYKGLFVNVFTCGSANYTVDDYLCGWYTMTSDYGLATVGSSKPGSMLYFDYFHNPLSEGKCIGQSMKEWWIEVAESDRSWFYGMTTIGDPTLSPLRKDVNPPGNVTDLYAVMNGTDVALDWDEPRTNDVHHYHIYRSTTLNGFDFSTPYHNTSGDMNPLQTGWTDTGAGEGDMNTYYYVVRAVDCGWNEEKNEWKAVKQVFSLNEGWNLVSIPVEMKDTSFDGVLGSSGLDPEKAMYFDPSQGVWKTYLRERLEHYNSIDVWNTEMGLWVNLDAQADMYVAGRVVQQRNITLQPGWNLVGYPSHVEENNGLPAEVDKIGYFDGAATYNLAYDYSPASFTFNPGEGYWIHNPTSSAVVWDVTY